MMDKKDIFLDIPLIYQPEDKDYCALACVQMIAGYFNDPITTEELEADLSTVLANKNTGITPAGARVLVERGLTVDLQTRQLELMTSDLIDRTFDSASELKGVLDKHKESFSENASAQWKEFLHFVEAGGSLSTHLATLNEIDESLESGNPVRINIAPKALRPESNFNNHAVVVVGKNEEGYMINDPSPRSAGQYVVDPDTLLFAWYARGATLFTTSMKT